MKKLSDSIACCVMIDVGHDLQWTDKISVKLDKE
jgi:hypothetical protein